MRLTIVLISALVSTSSNARSPDLDLILQDLLSQKISFDCDYTAKVDRRITKKITQSGTDHLTAIPNFGYDNFTWNPSNIPQSIRMVCDKQPDGTKFLDDIFDCNRLVPEDEVIVKNVKDPSKIYFRLLYSAEYTHSLPRYSRKVRISYEGDWKNGKFVRLNIKHSDISTDIWKPVALGVGGPYKSSQEFHEFGTYGRQEITKESCRIY